MTSLPPMGMKTPRSRRRTPKVLRLGSRTARRGGLTIVECMIALAIAVVLLTATTMAFTASAQAMQYNDEFFQATQAGRISLLRILSQIRNGTVSERNPLTGVPFTDNATTDSIEIITNATPSKPSQDFTYKYDTTTGPTGMLRMWVNPAAAGDPGYVLARNITTLTFRIGLGTDANNAVCVSQVAVSIQVKVGNNQVYLSGSAAPRRMLNYQ